MPRAEQPLPDSADPLTGFARELRELRVRAGSPTYRELARRSHYSPTTLADAAGGKRLPSLAAALAYARACGGDVTEWEARWRAVCRQLNPSGELDEENGEQSGKAPYVGLAAFQAEDAERFFGRSEFVGTLVRRISAQRFVALFGASGVGKSSVLRAGLSPRLPGPVLLLTPGRRPVEECAVRLAALTGRSAPVLRAELASPDGLHLVARQLHADTGTELHVVVDQFEEVFTLCTDPAEREAFLALLLHAVRAETSRVRVVLGVRTDFLTHCAAHAELATALRDAQVLLGPMTADELREAVTRPALAAGQRLESALLAVLMAEAAGRPGALPLVSHALLETWFRRRGNTLTLRGYQEAGGIAHAIARTAETVYAGLDEAGQGIARDLFLRLTTLGEGTEDTRRRVGRGELDSSPAAAHVVEALTAARLVTADRDTLEISHEVLLHAWPRLHDWLSADREGLRTHRQLTEAAATWESLHRDPAALYRGTRLDRALDWAAGDGASMTVREREFLAASRSEREREREHGRRRQRRQRQLSVAVVVFALIASLAAVVASVQWGIAADQRDEATFRQVVSEADRLAEADPTLSAQLLVAAHRMRPEDEAVRSRLVSTRTRPLATSTVAHQRRVHQVAYGQGGTLLASVGEEGGVRLWEVRDRLKLSPLGGPLTDGGGARLNSARFSPDSTQLVAVGHDGRLLRWDVRDPARSRRLSDLATGLDVDTYELAFHPDGRRVATAHSDGVVRVWDLGDREHPKLWREWAVGPDRASAGVAFSPDGRLLATGGDSGVVDVWDLDNLSRPLRTVETGQNAVYSLAFRPDSAVLATAGGNGVLRLWRVADGGQLGLPVAAHSRDVWQVAFNAEGTVLVTAGADGTAVLWNVTDPAATTRLGVRLSGGGSILYGAAISPDGTVLATADNDGRIRLWDLPSDLLVGHRDTVDSVDVRPDGKLVAIGDRGNTIRLWSTVDGERPAPAGEIPPPPGLRTCTHCQSQLRFGPDGRLLVALTGGHLLRLFDLTEPAHPVLLREERLGTVYTSSIALSPDGRVLVVNSDDHVTSLWDIADPRQPKPLHTLPRRPGEIGALAFRPDGAVLAVSGSDNQLVLWNVSDPANPRWLGAGAIEGLGGILEFSPDGTTIAEASEEPRVWLWDVRDPTRPSRDPDPLTGHTKEVGTVRWSADGAHLVTSGGDNSVRRWHLANRQGAPVAEGGGKVLAFLPGGRLLTGEGRNTVRVVDLDPERAVDRVCRTAGSLDGPRWRQHLPGVPPQEMCPGTS
ncbi:WD40 repeat protein/transcriptional regulator with XRE-family HTH domain [Crossiella equi]|uniref:WD40 repeat protein/transcriptional regulator with XRE-family HTH domain n=2 Tax=Crossiella equi TaxID=130796 RepID=A0ABS5A9M8_9PSEU|nr:WD40 repeat domain-containing protein [Crossiella equi]MBP2472450.1 WD40 repeat protein/transcriptional regulator with XRE-family HTH domain [Crossiella equi]